MSEPPTAPGDLYEAVEEVVGPYLRLLGATDIEAPLRGITARLSSYWKVGRPYVGSGHRIEGEHDCFAMDCAGMAHEIDALRSMVAGGGGA